MYFEDEMDEFGERIDRDDTNVYSRHVRQLLVEDDEMDPFEEGFLSGYEDGYEGAV